MKKIIATISLVATAAIFSSCTPAPVHVQDINIVKVVPKPKLNKKKPKKVKKKATDRAEDFRAISS